MDFLAFKSFISVDVLILFYYLGAFILPVGMWLLLTWLIETYELFNTAYEKSKEIIWAVLNTKQKVMIVAMFLTSFLFMELFWRMLFEYLIAYMQMRDALLHIQQFIE